jgi:hypothetical protein
VANSLNNLGLVLGAERDFAGARRLIEESLALSRELGDRTAIAFVLEIGARLAAATGRGSDALQLAAAAKTLRETIGSPLSPAEQERLDQALAGARGEIPPEAAAAGEARARQEPAEDLFPRLFDPSSQPGPAR